MNFKFCSPSYLKKIKPIIMKKINFKKLITGSAILILVSITCTFSDIYAQKIKTENNLGGRFDSGKYIFSTKSKYTEINQDKIKAVRLSVKEISPADAASSFLFYPKKQEGNSTSLMDLLIWAIREKGLPFYDAFSSTLFSSQFKVRDLDSLINRNTHEGDILHKRDLSAPVSWLVYEATIYDLNNKIIAVRPIGLAPVSTYSFKTEDDSTIRRFVLFQVCFPDIMDILSNYYPADKIRGIKNGLDLFVNNLYGGKDISRTYFGDYINLLGSLPDTLEVRYGFDTLWISKKIKKGIFINNSESRLIGNFPVKADKKTIVPIEFSAESPDIAFTKITQKQINLRDTANYPIYFPLEPMCGNRSLSDAIMEGLRNGKLIACDFLSDTSLSVPLTLNEINKMMSETKSIVAFGSDGNSMKDTLVSYDFPSSDIKNYYLNEAEFYDSKNNLIGSRVISLSPILERYVPEIGNMRKKPLFEIPLSEESFKATLAQNKITSFSQESPVSFLTFLLEKKYKAENEYRFPSSLNEVRRQLGLKPPAPSNGVINKYLSLLSPVKEAKLVTREINRSDTANYPLFYPEYPHYGLTPFFDFLRNTLINGKTGASACNKSDLPGETLSLSDINNIMEREVRINDLTTGLDRIEHVLYNSDEIEKYLVEELVTDSLIIPIAICPVQGTENSGNHVNMLWVYFSAQFRAVANSQEVLRLKGEKEISFADYLLSGKYKGAIINEKLLNASDVARILQILR